MFAGKTLGVIGAGNMAEALINGVLKAGLIPADKITACDLSEARREVFSGLGCNVTERMDQVITQDVILLALKPQVVFSVMDDIGTRLSDKQLLISIAAGITIGSLQKVAPSVRIVRVMPNTPMLVGEGVCGVAPGASATEEDAKLTLALCGSAADAYEVVESQMDAVTGLSGSGPAYLFYFAEILTEAGVAAGLPADIAEKMAAKTVFGSAKLLIESSDPAEVLRRKVTSPNGTTEAALNVMTERGMKDILIAAVLRAKERSEELAQGR